MINYKENFKNSLTSSTKITPVAPITTIVLMEYMEKTGAKFPEAHTDADNMMELAAAPYNYSGIEGINIPFDMTIESEAIGCKVDLRSDDQRPEVIETPFNNPDDISIPDDFLYNGRMPVLFDAIEKIQEKYQEVPLIVGVVGPFTLLGQLLGIEELLKLVVTDYFEIEEAISIVTDALLDFTSKIDSYSVDAICVCEPSSSSDLLNPDIFKRLVTPELELLSDNIQSGSILHICGDTTPIIPDMLRVGYDAISIENSVDLDYVMNKRAELNSNTKICGNISTNKALLLGSMDDVINESVNALEKGVDILCSSCSVPPHSPEENVHAMITARDEYISK